MTIIDSLTPQSHLLMSLKDEKEYNGAYPEINLIQSDYASPSSYSTSNSPAPGINAQLAFPAVHKPAMLMRRMGGSQDLDAFCSVASVFLHCLDAVLHSMNHPPVQKRLASSYEEACHALTFTRNLLAAHISRFTTLLSSSEKEDIIHIGIQLVDMTMGGLRVFLAIAQKAKSLDKPLPAPPEIPVELAEEPVINSFDLPQATDTCNALNVDSNLELGILRCEEKEQSISTQAHLRTRGKNLLGRLLFSASKSSILLSPQSSPRMPAMPLGNDPLCATEGSGSPTSSTGDCPPSTAVKRANHVYSIRQSQLIFPDPAAPNVDVEMPRPSGEAFSIKLNEHGKIIGASVSALVRILTSKEAVTDQEFTEMFFMCFRYFSTPLEIFDKLCGRYDEKPPVSLTEAQSRVFEQESMLVKIRVSKVLLTWLDLHWRQDMDHEVFDPLLLFAYKRLASEIPSQLSGKLSEALHKCATNGATYRGRRMHRRNELAEMMLKVTPCPPTNFQIPDLDYEGTSGDRIEKFYSDAGHRELAYQLTLKASGLYCIIDPEDAVLHWKDGNNITTGQQVSDLIAFERAVRTWVVRSILDKIDPDTRAFAISFWLDIATICLQMRNFSIARAISSGIACGTVDRLKHTISRLSSSCKMQRQILEEMFSCFGNMRAYRLALGSSQMPAIPLMYALIRDARVAAQETSAHTTLIDHDPESEKVVNVNRYHVIAKTVRAMEQCHLPYKITRVDAVQALIQYEVSNNTSLEQDALLLSQLAQKSEELEPKADMLCER